MPLLSPAQVHEVLKQETRSQIQQSGKKDLQFLLEKNNLTPDEVLDHLSSLMRSSETESVRLKAAETALKLNGLLEKDSERGDFSVTINIIDSEFSGVNPILIPR